MAKWKRLSDAALKDSNFELCEAASLASNDYAGLLLMYTAIGNLDGMEQLAKSAEADGKTNIAFSAYLLSGDVEACANILISTNRLPEAAFFARTYLPSRVDEIVALWKADLSKVSESAAQALATPEEQKEMFPDYDIAVQVEKMFLSQRAATQSVGIPALDYLTAKDDLDLNLIDLIKAQSQPAQPAETPVAEAASPEAPEEDDNDDNDDNDDVPMEGGDDDAVAAQNAELEEQARAEAEALAAAKKLEEEAELAAAQLAEEEAALAAQAAAAAADEDMGDEDEDDFADDWD